MLIFGHAKAHGGKRLGGSLIGGFLSRVGNRMFNFLSGSVLSDATTGIKMFRKDLFDQLDLKAEPVGWAVVFELAVKAQSAGYKLGEVPIVSIDRIYGGESTFMLGPWFKEYLKWFFWGVKNLHRFKDRPKGYGYLVPSSENKEILGVLFESNIFPGRCREDQILFRIMIGGARHPDILSKTKEDLMCLALKEIESLGFQAAEGEEGPQEVFFVPWAKAIPQYDQTYVEVQGRVSEHLQQWPNLKIVSNYWKGISLNDCIENAFQTAQNSSL